jgi:hypothetical protein
LGIRIGKGEASRKPRRGEGAAARIGSKFRHRSIKRRRGAAEDVHECAFFNEAFSCGKSDAGRAAGDHRGLAFQSGRHVVLVFDLPRDAKGLRAFASFRAHRAWKWEQRFSSLALKGVLLCRQRRNAGQLFSRRLWSAGFPVRPRPGLRVGVPNSATQRGKFRHYPIV